MTFDEGFKRFSKNRRGFISLWILIFLLVISLITPWIANEKPLLISYEGKFYCPLLRSYPEKIFGGDFETEASYRDPLIQENIQAKGWMVWPLIPFNDRTNDETLDQPAPTPPSSVHWLGTDDQGRDVLARLLYGLRVSLFFGLLLTLLSSTLGLAAGAVQGYFGGLVDFSLQRFVEIWGGLPILFILIILSSMVQPTFFSLLFIMMLFSWTTLVPVVRAEFLRARKLEYVRAAYALGIPTWRIIIVHILPNALIATLTYAPFILSQSITSLTALDFLGLGLPPGSPSLGELLLQGKNNLHAPWLGITGFLAMAVLLSILIFIGEALRDALDARKESLTAWSYQ